MKRSLLFLMSLFITLAVISEPVSMLTARKVAQNYYSLMAEKTGNKSAWPTELDHAITYTNTHFYQVEPSDMEVSLFYVFNANNNNGFVIVSADDLALPVIGYSFSGNFTGENLPPALQGLLERRADEMLELISSGVSSAAELKSAWSGLTEEKGSLKFKSFSAVEPLMSTTWDQAPFYNDFCPYDNNYNELTVTGCPATAMAQIMKFWSYPETGYGYHSYNTGNYGTLSANFEATTYDWNNMPDAINNSNNAIATLMYHCGVAVEMEYGVAETGGSGAYVIQAQSPIQHCSEYAFKTYFGYKTTMQGLFRDDYNDATWIQMLKTELDAGRPVQYAGFGQGGGHTWVCDGYENDNNFHMNWGWGGTYDGYYSLDQLSPGTGGAGGGSGSFNAGQQALIGIEPGDGGGGGGPQFDLRAYSNIFVDPYPINFVGAFDVSIDVGNFDANDFSGSLAAVLFNEQGNWVGIIGEVTGVSIMSEYYDSFTFHTDGMIATPGNYYIGIYYKPSGSTDWAIIGPGEYGNYGAVEIVGPPNDLQMWESIVINPEVIVSNEDFQVMVDIANLGNQTFNGMVSADLYDSEGFYVAELAVASVYLPSNIYVDDLQLNCNGVDVLAGSYILAIWDTPNGEDWTLVGSDNYPNPIIIQITAPQIPGDMFENNDEVQDAYQLPLNIPGSQVVINTEGSTIHVGNDMDYYKLDLPAGSQYKITARAHDLYNSENGQTYTDDVIWALGDGENWTDVFDDVANGFFVFNGGQTIYFVVSNYYQGQTGTYLLEMLIEKGTFGVDEITDADLVNLYPNPTSGMVTLSSNDWKKLSLPLEIEVTDMTGRSVFRRSVSNSDISNLSLNMTDLKEGVYYLRVKGQKGYIDKKLVIIR